jgi:hypothetical protein
MVDARQRRKGRVGRRRRGGAWAAERVKPKISSKKIIIINIFKLVFRDF